MAQKDQKQEGMSCGEVYTCCVWLLTFLCHAYTLTIILFYSIYEIVVRVWYKIRYVDVL